MYSAASQTWRTFFLSQRRNGIAAASVGKKVLPRDKQANYFFLWIELPYKVFFAGGYYQSGASGSSALVAVPTVDTFDLATNTWSKRALTAPRTHISGGAAGDVAIFAGEGLSFASVHSL